MLFLWDFTLALLGFTLSQTSHGDLAALIEGQFDTSMGQLTDKGTFKKVIGKMGIAPAEIVFLTKAAKEGIAAKV